jgi:phytanoyl-CoA hydroxylase
MWLDSIEAEIAISKITDDVCRVAAHELRTDGFTILSSVLTNSECENAIRDFDEFCSTNVLDAQKHQLSSGFHSRLYNLHATSSDVRKIALNETVLKVLDCIFPAKAALNSTLFFEQGSEQAIHRDTPFFISKPFAGEFVGV